MFKFLKRAISHKTGRYALGFLATSIVNVVAPESAGVVGQVREVVEVLLAPEVVFPVGVSGILLRDRQAKVDRGED